MCLETEEMYVGTIAWEHWGFVWQPHPGVNVGMCGKGILGAQGMS